MQKIKLALAILAILLLALNCYAANDYMIADLTASSPSTAITYLDSAPSDLLTNDAYKTTKIVLKKIPKGTFVMGSPPSEPKRLQDIEENQVSVTLSKDFYIAVFETTQTQWNYIKGPQPTCGSSCSKQAVTNLNWTDIHGAVSPSTAPTSSSFAGTLSTKTGLKFDLPTEAQWEYACRAGTTTALYDGPVSGTEGYDPNASKIGWYLDDDGTLHTPGQRAPNNWGLYDMSGNASEWVRDWYWLYNVGGTDPLRSTQNNSPHKTLKGGSYANSVSYLRCADKTANNLANQQEGFRIAADVISSTPQPPDQPVKSCGVLTQPDKMEWNDNGLNGYYTSATSPGKSYNEIAGECHWRCKTNYQINGYQTSCSPKTQTANCSILQNLASLPAHWTDTTKNGTFTQTWNGTIFSPTDKNTFHDSRVLECAWECDTNYGFIDGNCILNPKRVQCAAQKPNNTIWNDQGMNGYFNQLIVNETWSPTQESQTTTYSTTPGNCKWTCDENHYINPDLNECIYAFRKTTACSLTDTNNVLPETAQWNDPDNNIQNEGLFTQRKTDTSWVPTIKKAFYSEDPSECAYSCIALTKTCELNKTTYCGLGEQDCNKGYWTACQPTEGTNICTINQYCNNTTKECTFCQTGYKNCDSNLLNGCEANILSDKNNCGTCGNTCATSEYCVSGSCSATPPSDRNCQTITCGANSTCSQTTISCECTNGYNNCDSNTLNGCETFGDCTPQYECTTDSDCDLGKQCTNHFCIEKPECLTDADCPSTKECQDQKCVALSCRNNYSAKNHSCVCETNICGEQCYTGQGICCNTTWNTGIDSCEYSAKDKLLVINQARDNEAKQFLADSLQSAAVGEISKARAEGALAELKAQLTLNNNPPGIVEKYDQAKLALQDENYSNAEQLATDALQILQETKNNFDITNNLPLIGAIIAALLIILLIARKQKKKKELQNL